MFQAESTRIAPDVKLGKNGRFMHLSIFMDA